MKNKFHYKTIFSLNKFNWDFNYSGIEYIYDTIKHCDEAGCDSICRCSTIENIEIQEVDLLSITNYILAQRSRVKYFGSKPPGVDLTFLGYCIHRLLISNKIYNGDNWHVSVSHGYYGEEVDGIFLENNDVKDKIKQLINLNKDNRIRFALQDEYGFILDNIKSAVFDVATVSTKQLNIGNRDYVKKVTPGLYKDDYNFPIGVYRKNGDKFILVDGYHRYIDLAANKDKMVDIICFT